MLVRVALSIVTKLSVHSDLLVPPKINLPCDVYFSAAGLQLLAASVPTVLGVVASSYECPIIAGVFFTALRVT